MAERPRAYLLDALRGLAALSVVLFHWKQFLWVGTTPGHVDYHALPGSTLLWFFYTRGGQAVDLFFVLSGFVFYWLYSDAIAQRRVGAREFAILRFSRLYPLHFATLIIVAVGQAIYIARTGSPFVYGITDAKHFLLHLGFASYWGLQDGFSFNGPVWSVSIEIALYAIFFLTARFFSRGIWAAAFMALVGIVMMLVYPPIARGLCGFFVGGCTYLVYSRMNPRWASAVWAAALLAWIATFVFAYRPGATHVAMKIWPTFVLFPITVLSVALLEQRWPRIGRPFAWLGDISYSTYMLHFPAELMVMIAATFVAFKVPVYSGWALITWFAVLILLGRASYKFFEIPAQRAIRGRFLSRQPRVAAAEEGSVSVAAAERPAP